MKIDLNCDMGESYGAWKMGADGEVMPHISSANIACGFHGGDPATIRKAVRIAVDHGVAIGAHPSLPDIQGFGRRVMKISPQEMYDLVVYQAGAVEGFARAAGSRLHHIKCHGALYNMAANDEALSDAMVRAAKDLGAMLYVLSRSQNYDIAKRAGVPVCGEVFADRGYTDEGTLAPRDKPGGMIEDAHKAVAQALAMIEQGYVTSLSGKRVAVAAETLCIHGDQPGAAGFSRNPMYLGDLLILAGWTLWLANALAFVGPPLFIAYIDRFQIAPEERILAARFGAAYAEYCRAVRRWL